MGYKILGGDGFIRARGGYPVIAATPGAATLYVLSASPATNVTEGATAVIRVSVSEASDNDFTFDYTTINGSAIGGTDFTIVSATGTIPAGSLFTDISVVTLLRSGDNGTRSFIFRVTAAYHEGVTIEISNSDTTVTITDITVAPVLPVLSVALIANQLEGTPIGFRVTATSAQSVPITFNYATSNGAAIAGTDYTNTNGSGSIIIGQTYVDIFVPTTARVGYQGARAFTFTISNGVMSENALTIFTSAATGTILESESPTGDHGYFETLIARTDYYTGYSMRPLAGRTSATYLSGPQTGKRDPYYVDQLKHSDRGGYIAGSFSSTQGRNVFSYDPSSDTHLEAQDACKMSLPAFWDGTALKTALLPGDTTINVASPNSVTNGIAMLIDDELVETRSGQTLDGTGGRLIPVYRGRYGTAAVSHTVGTLARANRNGLSGPWYFRPPIGTSDGNNYFMTWDFYHTSEFLGAPVYGWKAYQFGSSTASNWLELRTQFNPAAAYQPPAWNQVTDICVSDCRNYEGAATSNPDWSAVNGIHPEGKLSRTAYTNNIQVSFGSDGIYPGTNATGPTARNGGFISKPYRWTRVFFYYEQHLNNWDKVWLWMANADSGIYTVYDNLHLSIGNPGNLRDWWCEFNTSQENFTRPWTIATGAIADYASPRLLPNLTVYVRNFVVLKNVGSSVTDVLPLLIAPTA